VKILFFLLSFNIAFAEIPGDRSVDVCKKKTLHEEVTNLLSVPGAFRWLRFGVDWWAADKKDVQRAKCRKDIPSLKEIEQYINGLASVGAKENREINGVTFEGESKELLDVFYGLTTSLDLFGREDESITQFDYQGAFEVNPDCKKVVCAIEKIFGKNIGLKMFYLKHKYGFNSSPFVYINSDILRESEIDNFIQAAQDFPSFVFPIDQNRQMTKFKRGYTLKFYEGKSGVVANAMMTFFDSWSELKNDEMRVYTASHELGHYIAGELDLDDDPRWLALSGWEDLGGSNWRNDCKKCFVSNYAKSSPAEDFAETVAAYRYNPELLKKKSPKKYIFVKEAVYRGLEYTDPNLCQLKNSFENKFISEIKAKRLEEQENGVSSDFIVKTEDVLPECKGEVLNFILNRGNFEAELRSCFDRTMTLLAQKHHASKVSSNLTYPDLFYKNLLETNHNIFNHDLVSDDMIEASYNTQTRLLQDQVVKAFLKRDSKFKYIYGLGLREVKTPPKEFCSSWGLHGSLSFGELARDYLLDQYYNTINKDDLNVFFQDICVKVQSKKEVRTKMSEQELREALGYEH